MTKKAFLMLTLALSCPGICLLGSCGGGGATLTTDNVNGIWMPDGSHVNANLENAVTVEHNTGSFARARSAEKATPRSISWVLEAGDQGVLCVDGRSKACAVRYAQTDLSFDLQLVANDGTVAVAFRNGNIPSADSQTATAEWILYDQGGNVTAHGTRAVLNRKIAF